MMLRPSMAGSSIYSSAVLTLGAGIATRLLIFLMTVLVARRLSPEGYGQFTFATGCALLVAQGAGLGWPMLMSRLLPSFRGQEDWAAMRGLLRWADIVVIATSTLATVILATIVLLAGLKAEIAAGLALALFLIVPNAINLARRSQLAGIRRPASGILLDEGVPPAILVAALFFLGIDDPKRAVVWLAAATVFAAAAATVTLWRGVPREVWRAQSRGEPRTWTAMAFPLLLGLLSKLLMDRMDILMLGPLGGFEETGYYGAAYRLTYLLTFPQVMLMTVMTPMLSEMYVSGSHARLWRAFRLSIVFALATSLPASLLLFLFSTEILSLAYGSGYAPAASALEVLALVQCVTAVAIPCTSLLVATGHGRSYGAFSLIGLVANALLNLVLIQSMGATGAALACLAGVSIIFLGQGRQIVRMRKSMKIEG